jgi:hypothetical protein
MLRVDITPSNNKTCTNILIANSAVRKSRFYLTAAGRLDYLKGSFKL